MPLSIEVLKTLVAVSQTGNFTHAAKRVYRTQAAVSIQMKGLEEYLGKPLFRRDKRGILLNDNGQLLVGYATRILSLHHEVLSQFKEAELTGTVRLGTPDDYAVSVLPRLLSRFSEVHPNVHVEVRCAGSTELQLALEADEVDLAIMSSEPGHDEGHELMLDQLIWVAAEGSDIYQQRPLPLAIYPASSKFYEWAINALKASSIPHRTVFSGSSVLVLQAAVSAGLAVAPLLRSANRLKLKEVGQEHGLPDLPKVRVSLVLPQQPLTDASKRLANHLVDSFSKSPLTSQ